MEMALTVTVTATPPPPPCASTLKVRRTTVRQAPVLRQAGACARRAVPKEGMSPKTCPYLTLSTIVPTRHIYSVVMELHQHNVHNFLSTKIQRLVNDESHHLSIGFHLFSHRGNDVAMPPPMAENHIKTDNIGLQLQAECWYGQEEVPSA